MTQTNYLSPEMFDYFIKGIELVRHYNALKRTNQKGIPSERDLVMLTKIQYGCGLRITEALNLTLDDFDLDSKILTLNNTKTGFRKCSKCKGKDLNCSKCDGRGKIRIKQFTTIPPYLISELRNYLKSKDVWGNQKDLFKNVTRQVVWSYYKKAGKLAGLNIAEQQDEKFINGVWTHLLRKSCSKRMAELGASRELRMVKLRHSNKDAHDRYDRPDINALLKWEAKHLGVNYVWEREYLSVSNQIIKGERT